MIWFGDDQPLFGVGQLVSHRRYGYRGVVVAVDPECRAPEQWYLSNRSQPARKQAWYHVLVHDGEQTTYAAQSSLQADVSRLPIRHPLVEQFFSAFTDGCYQRNERTWRGWA